MIRMIATTISNSISEKPFCFRISFFSPILRLSGVFVDPVAELGAFWRPMPRSVSKWCALWVNLKPVNELKHLPLQTQTAMMPDFVARHDNFCQFATGTKTAQLPLEAFRAV
jgi:hypothetical protein